MSFFNNVSMEDEEILEKRKSELKASLKGLEGEQKDILDKFKAIKNQAISKTTGRNINYNFLVEKDRKEFLGLLDAMYSYVKKSEDELKDSGKFFLCLNKAKDWLAGTRFKSEVREPIEEYITFVVNEYKRIGGISKDNQKARINSAVKLVKSMYVNMAVVQNSVKKYIKYRYAKNNDSKTENQIDIKEYEMVFLKILFSIAGIRSEGTDLNTSLDKGIFERLVTNTITTIRREFGVNSKSY